MASATTTKEAACAGCDAAPWRGAHCRACERDRDAFAAAALSGLLASGWSASYGATVMESFALADAMIEARKARRG